MNVKILFSILLIAISFGFAHMSLAQTNTQCRWISSTPNDTQACQRFFQTDSKQWQNNTQCDASNKYIVIGIIAGVLGVIAILSFALNKNDTE